MLHAGTLLIKNPTNAAASKISLILLIFFKAVKPEWFTGNLICYKFNSPQWDINCIRQRKVWLHIVLLTLGAGAKAMLLGRVPKPLPCTPSGNLTAPMDGRPGCVLSWMCLEWCWQLWVRGQLVIKVSGPNDRTDRHACRIPVLAFKSRWTSWSSFVLIQLTARLS